MTDHRSAEKDGPSGRLMCMSCAQVKQHPDGFPNRAFAECWECAWDAHIRNAHPKIVRRIRREARKRARRLTEREVAAAMTERERRQVLRGPITPAGKTTSGEGGEPS